MRKRVRSSLLLTLTIVGVTVIIGASKMCAQDKPSILDKVLDLSLRRAGVDAKSKEAELAKQFGKDWLNPFTSDEEIRRNLERTRDHILNPTERGKIERVWTDKSSSEEDKVSHILTIVHKASIHSPDDQDRLRAAVIAHSGLLKKSTAMGLPTHEHLIRDLVVTGSEQDLTELLKLQRNPSRYDILRIHAGRGKFPTEVIETIKKWVHDGHVLWLPIVDLLGGSLGGDRGIYFGLEFGIDVTVAESVKKSVEFIPYLAPSGSLKFSEDKKPISKAVEGELTTGVTKIRLKGQVLRSESNVRHLGSHTAGTYHATYIFYTFSGLDTPLLMFKAKPCMGIKKYGKGYIVCLQPYHDTFDAPRFSLNLREWSGGYPVHKALVEYMQCPKCEKRYALGARFCQECGSKLEKLERSGIVETSEEETLSTKVNGSQPAVVSLYEKVYNFFNSRDYSYKVYLVVFALIVLLFLYLRFRLSLKGRAKARIRKRAKLLKKLEKTPADAPKDLHRQLTKKLSKANVRIEKFIKKLAKKIEKLETKLGKVEQGEKGDKKRRKLERKLKKARTARQILVESAQDKKKSPAIETKESEEDTESNS